MEETRTDDRREAGGGPTAFPAGRGSRPSSGRGSESGLLHRLGREIVGGTYGPAALLPPEAEMLARYGISRTALREAYSKLAAKGLLTARPKVGTSVLPQAAWNMLDPDVLGWHLQTVGPGAIAADLFALRRMIEPGAAELAALRHEAEDMARIDAALERMTENAGDEARLVEADLGFHRAVLGATRNRFAPAFGALIEAAMASTFALGWRGAHGDRARRLDQHAGVAEAIRARDPGRARERMEALLDDSFGDVRAELRRT